MNGTAVAGQDYEATSGTLVFDQREDSKTVYVPIEYDSNDENDETFTFVLSNARGAEIEDGVQPAPSWTTSNPRQQQKE